LAATSWRNKVNYNVFIYPVPITQLTANTLGRTILNAFSMFLIDCSKYVGKWKLTTKISNLHAKHLLIMKV